MLHRYFVISKVRGGVIILGSFFPVLPTQAVKEHAICLLQYAAAYPNNAVVYKKFKMHVIFQVDASYLSRSKARSVAGGIAYFGEVDDPTTENGIVHTVSCIIGVVVASHRINCPRSCPAGHSHPV